MAGGGGVRPNWVEVTCLLPKLFHMIDSVLYILVFLSCTLDLLPSLAGCQFLNNIFKNSITVFVTFRGILRRHKYFYKTSAVRIIQLYRHYTSI